MGSTTCCSSVSLAFQTLTPWPHSRYQPQASLLKSRPTSSVYLLVTLPTHLLQAPWSLPTPIVYHWTLLWLAASWGPSLSLQLPAHRTQDPAPRTRVASIIQGSRGGSAIYLSNKELELVRQNPWARIEVVLLRKEILHDSHGSAQSNFTHHLRHAWGEEKLWGLNSSGPLAIKQPWSRTFKTTHLTYSLLQTGFKKV